MKKQSCPVIPLKKENRYVFFPSSLNKKNNRMYEIIAGAVVNDSSVAMEAIKLVVCGSIGGAIVGGIMGALGKLWVDRKLERERANYKKELENLKAKLAQKQTIHKLQFENEFSIYLDLWKALIELRIACSSVVPGMKLVSGDESPEQRQDREADQLAKAYVNVVNLVEQQRPFYAQEVYESASQLISKAWNQAVQAGFGEGQPVSKRYEQMKHRVDEMSAIIDNIESSIRKRIGFINSAELVE